MHGQFYKTKMYDGVVTAVDMRGDSQESRMVSTAFQGLLNRDTAKVYLFLAGHHVSQLEDTGSEYRVLGLSQESNPGIRSMFREYSSEIRNVYIWDPDEIWSWNMALMLSSHNEGIPLTESLYSMLVEETGWKGNVERLKGRWTSQGAAYLWALENFMGRSHHNMLFSVGLREDWRTSPWTLYDYVVASKGFCFWLDETQPEDRDMIERICEEGDYLPGAVVMGYARSGDDLLKITNRYNIGYVVSDYYANGSFWSSYPNCSFRQRKGRALDAVPGKIYVSIIFSDGDNVQFDQNTLYTIWSEDTARGSFPIGTTLSAGLQELNPFLLEWYYSRKTANDELLAGPSGYQFIYGRDYNPEGYDSWLALNRKWLRSAGFRTSCLWHTSYGTEAFYEYMEKSCLEGVFTGEDDVVLDMHKGVIAMNQGPHLFKDGDMYSYLSSKAEEADDSKPCFLNVYPIAAMFWDQGITRLKKEAERLEKEYPGKFVFLLPKDNIATARKYYSKY